MYFSCMEHYDPMCESNVLTESVEHPVLILFGCYVDQYNDICHGAAMKRSPRRFLIMQRHQRKG